tara:strand:- start:14789 stop:16744 length:1956 start_codon:yes stop_codon:yes gene_type:complete
MRKIKYYIILFLSVTIFGCSVKSDFEDPIIDPVPETELPDGPLSSLNVPDEFSYATTKNVEVNFDVPLFLKGAVFTLYGKIAEQDSIVIGKGTFNDSGSFSKSFTLSARADSLLVFSNYIGLIDNVRLPIENNQVDFDYRPFYTRDGGNGKTVGVSKKNLNMTKKVDNYSFNDSYNSMGVPNNLAFSDVIEQNLLDDINASLPENVNGGVPVSNPDFLAGKETNLVITKEADIWVTFVSEGAGYRNVLGYYTYPIGQEPSSVSEIEPHYIIFPNVSMLYSGGGLIPGDRVHLGNFPANTVVSWFLASNGWNGSNVNDGNGVYYSNPNFNPESTSEKRNHMVLLQDEGRKLTLLGFEDLFRDGPSDDDFNDAVFYAKSNPADAIQTGNLASIKTATDADGDGINDELDDFPFDPNKAFNNFSPSINSTGKLVYEDLWPSRGDYDFNDLSLDYAFNLIANSDNLVTSLNATYTIEHIGGSFHNGFGFVLPIEPNMVASIEGQILNADYEVVATNGTELGTAPNETVVLVAGDAFSLTGTTIDIIVNFTAPLNESELGNVPFNTFLISNGDRTREVHLPDLLPTSKAAYLGTKNDYSDSFLGRYYKTASNLPWALNLYENFVTPPETVPITIQYPRFVNWANSGGTENLDWYLR